MFFRQKFIQKSIFLESMEIIKIKIRIFQKNRFRLDASFCYENSNLLVSAGHDGSLHWVDMRDARQVFEFFKQFRVRV